jgi:hypothetical protein
MAEFPEFLPVLFIRWAIMHDLPPVVVGGGGGEGGRIEHTHIHAYTLIHMQIQTWCGAQVEDEGARLRIQNVNCQVSHM